MEITWAIKVTRQATRSFEAMATELAKIYFESSEDIRPISINVCRTGLGDAFAEILRANGLPSQAING